MILTFDREHLKRLVASAKAATERSPVYDQLYDPRYRKDGKAPPDGAFPEPDDIDPTKIPPALWLVADHGVYLMSNAKVELPKGGKHDVAYAREADPNKVEFDDWWDVRSEVFGGDDGVELIPFDSLEEWLNRSHLPNAQIKLTPMQIEYL